MARPNYPDPDSERERGKELKQEKERLYDQREEDDIDAGVVKLLAEQGGRCAICRTDKPGGKWNRFAVDHDHEFGHVRGLLCTRCNMGLRFFNDSPTSLRAAALYMARAQPRLRLTGTPSRGIGRE